MPGRMIAGAVVHMTRASGSTTTTANILNHVALLCTVSLRAKRGQKRAATSTTRSHSNGPGAGTCRIRHHCRRLPARQSSQRMSLIPEVPRCARGCPILLLPRSRLQFQIPQLLLGRVLAPVVLSPKSPSHEHSKHLYHKPPHLKPIRQSPALQHQCAKPLFPRPMYL